MLNAPFLKNIFIGFSNIKNDLRTEFLQNTNEIYRLRDIMLRNEVITKNDF